MNNRLKILWPTSVKKIFKTFALVLYILVLRLQSVPTEVKMMAALRIYGASVEQNQKRLKRSLNIH